MMAVKGADKSKTFTPPISPTGSGLSAAGTTASSNATNGPANKNVAAILGLANQGAGVAVPTQEVDPSSTTKGDAYVPEIVVNNPAADPTAWNIQQPDISVYTGNGNASSSQKSMNQMIEQLASRLGISLHGKNQSTLEEQIAAKLPAPVSRQIGAVANSPGTGPGKALAFYSAASQAMGLSTTQPIQGQQQTAKITDLAQQIAHGGNLAQIQTQLYDGGFYSGSAYDDPTTAAFTPGHLDPQTMEAIGTALTYTAEYNKQNPQSPVTWEEAVKSQDFDVGAAGGISTLQGGGPAKIPSATEAQLSIPLQSASEAQLGMLPDQAQLSQFTSEFDASQAAHAGQALGTNTAEQQGPTGTNEIPSDASAGTEYGTGVTIVPGMPSSSTAAAEFAQSSDPDQYLAHRVANAYGMILNSVIGTRGEEATLPGYNQSATEQTIPA
jgi:hypothetical protein